VARLTRNPEAQPEPSPSLWRAGRGQTLGTETVGQFRFPCSRAAGVPHPLTPRRSHGHSTSAISCRHLYVPCSPRGGRGFVSPRTAGNALLVMVRASLIVGNAPTNPYWASIHERSNRVAVVSTPAIQHPLDTHDRS
jgi:hypothetical protein